jgi:bifunctional non-homologous end joining protein LigD
MTTTKPRVRKRTTPAKRASRTSVAVPLQEIEDRGGDGIVRVGTASLKVSNLAKTYFPQPKRTKGDVLRFYDRVAPVLLPVMADRPLVLKRFPNGIEGEAFFQQNAAETPEGVRVDTVPAESGESKRIIGGDLATLLYCAQLGAIEVNPWHSRIQSLEYPDYTILDLDPGPRATFATIVEVAITLQTFLDEAGVKAGLKTSGSRGLHIVIPLPPRTNEEAAQLVSHVFAQRCADAMPAKATVIRSRSARPEKAVYVDYLQNVIGKSVACAFSIRPRPGGTVSMPLSWDELGAKLDPAKFTMDMPEKDLLERGKMWMKVMGARNTLERIANSV